MAYLPKFFTHALIWKQIDHRSASLRKTLAAVEIGVKYFPSVAFYSNGNSLADLEAMAKVYIEWAEEWTEKLFLIYTGVWKEGGEENLVRFHESCIQ